MNRKTAFKLIVPLAVLSIMLLVAAPAPAGSYTFTGQVVAAFDLAFTPIALPNITTFPGFAAIYQIDYAITTLTVDVGELGFANLGVSIVPTAGVVDSSFAVGWTPTAEMVDTNGAVPGGAAPLFATNVDGGTPGDYVGILVSIAGGLTTSIPTDDRILVGQAPNGPRYAGSVFFEWDGLTLSTVDTTSVSFSANSITGTFLPSAPGPSDSILLGIIPEPSTLILAGFSLIGIFAGRRRV